MIQCIQEHQFNFLVKQYGHDYSAQVMEIPGIIIGSTKRTELKDKIEKATKAYLDFHDETHIKAQKQKLGSSLNTSNMGIILGIEKITVRC